MTMLFAPPSRDRRRNRASRVFGPPYPYFDRRARRTPVPGWRLRLNRSSAWGAIVGEVPPAKRIIDVAGSLALLVILSPLLLAIIVAIKFQAAGPALVWQTRVGRRGRCFALPKFGSTVEDGGTQIVTRVGLFIRKFGLDETPQLWSVLAGDMTLVGPRSPLPCEVDGYTPRELRRLEVAPGLICLWQIEGRSDLSFARQVDLDLRYIDNRSFWLDIKLLLRTPLTMLKGKGA